jgi:NADH-quinone oxidoreductase subunit J
MNWAVIVFYLLSAVAVLTAAGVILSRNPVHAAFALVVCFLNVAGLYIMLGAEFLAAVQVIVYTGAILVLFLFVLMLVRPQDLGELSHGSPVQVIFSWILGLALFFEFASVISTGILTGQRGSFTTAQVNALGGNTQVLGRVLYSNYLLPFEAASLVLLVAVVAAVILGVPERVLSRNAREAKLTISLGHPRGADLIEAASREGVTVVSPRDEGKPGVEDVDRASPTRNAEVGTRK